MARRPGRKWKRTPLTPRRVPTPRGNGVARYYQLYQILMAALQDGSINSGDLLPSEPELVRTYRVSRTTVRRALERLEQEGRIVRRRGSGTFACDRPEPPQLVFDLHRVYKEVPAIASRTSVQVLRFAPARIPPSLSCLAPELQSPVFLLQRVRSHHSTPYHLSTSYIPESLARRVRKKSLGRCALLTMLDEVGPQTATAEQATSAVAADSFASRHLKVALGSPLLRIRALLRDGQGRLRAFDESLFRPDRFNVHAELQIGNSRPTGGHSPLKHAKAHGK